MATTKTTKAKTTKKAGTARKAKAPKTAEPKLETKANAVGTHQGQSCKIASCKRAYRAKGYCAVHYKKWRQGDFGKKRYTSCSDYGCFRPQAMNRHGFCEQHFQDYYVKGIERARVVVEAPKEKEKAADEKAA